MKLTVLERIIALNIIPKEGDITSLKIVRVIKEALSFSEEEHKELNFKIGPHGETTWTPPKELEKEIEFGSKATSLIVTELNKLNAEKKLTPEHLSLYEKFIPEEK
jgi:hypothetical protein